MRTLLTAMACLVTFVLAGTALAGGWATVKLSSTPDGTRARTAWRVDLTVLQHGRTPLTGVQPVVRIRGAQGERTFVARSTRKPGVYRAEVVFPSAGKWRWEIWDGFSRTHTYSAVTIRAPIQH